MGPTTKLVSLGHIAPKDIADAFREQARALVDAGADALIVETCQDLLQVKLAVVSSLEAMEQAGREIPILASITIERTGTMLVGSDIAAAAATLEPFPLFSLGLNCATGPEEMESHLRYLHHNWPGRISCIPNQGLPEVVNGQTCYRLDADTYASRMRQMVEEFGVSIVGGCCGTTPEHIAKLVPALEGAVPAPGDSEDWDRASAGAGQT
jgi:5-methyltetrahydrofolate--homocysteine methyltransferase